MLKGAARWQAVVPVVRVVECFLGLLWHRQYIVLQVLGIPQCVGKGVEVQWLIHILILCLGWTIGSVVILGIIQSLKVSVFPPRNKRVLLHRVQVFWGNTQILVNIYFLECVNQTKVVQDGYLLFPDQLSHGFVFMSFHKNHFIDYFIDYFCHMTKE